MDQDGDPLGGMFRELIQGVAVANSVADKLVSQQGQTLARWTVLDLYSSGPRTVPSVARSLRQSRQSIQRVADLLVEEGLLARVPNPDHRTSPLYECTDAGAEVLQRLTQAVGDWYAYLHRAFSPAEIAGLTGSMQRLRAAAEEFGERL